MRGLRSGTMLVYFKEGSATAPNRPIDIIPPLTVDKITVAAQRKLRTTLLDVNHRLAHRRDYFFDLIIEGFDESTNAFGRLCDDEEVQLSADNARARGKNPVFLISKKIRD